MINFTYMMEHLLQIKYEARCFFCSTCAPFIYDVNKMYALSSLRCSFNSIFDCCKPKKYLTLSLFMSTIYMREQKCFRELHFSGGKT